MVCLVLTGIGMPLHCVYAEEGTPLILEIKIPLGDVHGRIDHLAIDVTRQRLYVAELGNDTVGVIDLKENKVLRTLKGLSEPQGIAYVPTTDTIYVANGGDGSVRIYNAADLTPIGKIDLGNDADNIRFDATSNRVYVGYGRGALSVIDPVTRQKVASIPLKGHPESFQVEDKGYRIFINIPGEHEVVVVDRERHKLIANWPSHELHANYAMSLDRAQQQVAVVFRSPSRLVAFSSKDGTVRWSTDTCEDSDDVFVDHVRRRVYVSCGEGVVETFEQHDGIYRRIGRLATVSGARTSLYSPELERLFVAVRATFTAPAAIWVLRPES
jgi:YVTN family beta-propeller protein